MKLKIVILFLINFCLSKIKHTQRKPKFDNSNNFARYLQVPPMVKANFAGLYQNPTIKLELGENYEQFKADKRQTVDKDNKITIEPVKFKDVFEVKSPSGVSGSGDRGGSGKNFVWRIL